MVFYNSLANSNNTSSRCNATISKNYYCMYNTVCTSCHPKQVTITARVTGTHSQHCQAVTQ